MFQSTASSDYKLFVVCLNHAGNIYITFMSENHGINDLLHEAMQYHI